MISYKIWRLLYFFFILNIFFNFVFIFIFLFIIFCWAYITLLIFLHQIWISFLVISILFNIQITLKAKYWIVKWHWEIYIHQLFKFNFCKISLLFLIFININLKQCFFNKWFKNCKILVKIKDFERYNYLGSVYCTVWIFLWFYWDAFWFYWKQRGKLTANSWVLSILLRIYYTFSYFIIEI